MQAVQPSSTGLLACALIGAQRKQACLDVTLTREQLAMLHYNPNGSDEQPYVLRVSSFLGSPRKKLHNHRWPLHSNAGVNTHTAQVSREDYAMSFTFGPMGTTSPAVHTLASGSGHSKGSILG